MGKKKPKTTPNWFLRLLGLAGIGLILGGFGLADFNYWLFVGVVVTGFIAVIVELIYGDWFIEGPIWRQILGINICIAGLVLFAITRVCIFDDSERMAYSVFGHQDGDVVEGISWNSHYADIRAVLGNHSDDDFEHVDVRIYPDYISRSAVFIGEHLECGLSPIAAGLNIHQTVSRQSGSVTINLNQSHGGADPQDTFGDKYEGFAHSGYELRCPQLPPHSEVRILFPAIQFKQQFRMASPPNSSGVEVLRGGSLMDALDEAPHVPAVEFVGGYKRKSKPITVSGKVSVKYN